jgi:AraC family transcriptional regulator, regulatory protein of adaptative response / DNA-3-methyladenine glycosylase II
VLGQQVTVAAGRTFTQRVAALFGSDLPNPLGEVRRVFPSAATLARVSASSLGELGIVSRRQQALLALAQAVDSGGLVLDATAPLQATLAHLQSLPGVGPWTANYIAMRALRWPDAFVAGDVALQRALGMTKAERDKPAQAARRAEDLSQAWRPWRSYAVVRSWNTL